MTKITFVENYQIQEKQVQEQTANEATERAMALLASTFLHAATVTHFMHLKTRSFSQHQALGSFYTELPGKIDKIVESYQGKYGLLSNYAETYYNLDLDPVSYLENLKDTLAALRISIPQDSEIQNEVDEISSLINTTLYKLRFLL